MDKIEKFERLADSSAEFETDAEATEEANRFKEIIALVNSGELTNVPVLDAQGNEVGVSYVDKQNKVVYYQSHNVEDEYQKRFNQNSREN